MKLQRLLVSTTCVSLLTLSASAAEPLRPPAVPLVTHDPYFSIWSPADKLTDADTVHWTGKPHRLTSLVQIDGKAFRLMGTSPTNVPALPQTGLEVTPTRTIYTFEGESMKLTLTFMTPVLPDDLALGSRPVTYVSWELLSVDRRDRAVRIYFEASPELAVHESSQMVTGSQVDQAGLCVRSIGSVGQPVLQQKGDDRRIDWGHLLMASPTRAYSATELAFPMAARTTFVAKGGVTPDAGSAALPAPASKAPAAVTTFDMAEVGAVPGRCWLMLAYDDEFSIKYFRQNLRPYWRRNGDDAAALLKKAAADYESLKSRCEQFDAELMADLRNVGGEKYAQLCALAYRQTFAGNKVCADANGQPLMFPKENFSNGCIGTVDVLFPQAPFFLVFSPALTKAMLVPILDYAASPRWPYGYAPHDLGTYPHATGQVYGMNGKDGDRMPVEESGNMLIMLTALAKHEGNADLAKKYWPMLTKWAEYLVKEGLDPANQLCSADMFGHLPRNANLALKAIIGIGGFAQLCELAGKPDDAKKYLVIAQDYAAKWQDLARGEGRTILAYGQPNTWAMKHNLIWDRVLGLNLIPQSIGDAEIAWYLKVQKKYGLPVDNRTDTSLIDWALWSIAPARNDADFQALLEPIWRYANETPSRVPLSDWFVTTDARRKGFQARPVVGGIFIKMLADPVTWQKWAQRGANNRGPWAPIPIGIAAKENVPTAQTAQVKWRFTLEQPAEDWVKPGFNDGVWKEGTGGFGTKGTPGAIIGTEWTTKQIWLRREFTLPDRAMKNPRLLLIYDEDPEVYLNGVLAVKLSGWTTSYEEADIAPAALAALKPGKNVMAVRASQTYGGQCIDAGIVMDGDPDVTGVPPAQPTTSEAASSQGNPNLRPPPAAARRESSAYRGWKTVHLSNGLIELQVLPDIGGRIIQFKLGGKEFLWVNPQLAGKLPPSNGLAADGGWFNVGGDKLWPAPQGWDNDQQWSGPPDAVLDGQPYELENLPSQRGESAVRLTSGKDPRSGIQFSRVLRIFDGSTRVSFEATMKNIDTRPRRWGLWAHTQLDGARADGAAHNPLMRAWCPLNPQSQFPKGYDVIFGEKNNPSFQPDAARGLMRVQYKYRVGKIGLDSPAGWVATVDGESGAVFVQRFVFEPKKEYPDGSSVEFWLNGVGQIHAYNRDLVMATNAAENPYVFESEVLSPFAQLKPGQSFTWRYDWYACNIGGDFPILDCTPAGVTSEPLTAKFANGKAEVRGRFGVFSPGRLRMVFLDQQGRRLSQEDWPDLVNPLRPAVVNHRSQPPPQMASVTLVLVNKTGKAVGELGHASLAK